MKMRIHISTLSVALSAIASIACTRVGINDDLRDYPIFKSSLEIVSSSSKAYLDNDRKLCWTADDRISVFSGSSTNLEYHFTGVTGEKSGEFENCEPSGDQTSGSLLSANYAVYPYSENINIDSYGIIGLTLPAVQKYAANGFGLGANTMVAVTDGTNDRMFRFKNVCGYLVLRIFGDDSLKNIMLIANKGECIAGQASLLITYGQNPELTINETATDTITLDCGSGTTLGAGESTATEFWFCVPPVTFSNGFTIRLTNADGLIHEKSLDKALDIERNTFVFMSPFEAIFEQTPPPLPEKVDLGLSVKWASFNVGAGSAEEYGDYYAWGSTETLYENKYALEDPQKHWKTGKTDGYIWTNAPYQTVNTDNWNDTRWTKYLGSKNSKFKDQNATDSDALKNVLDPDDDIARISYGGSWRMPTIEEFNELKDKCLWTWTSIGGVDGYKVSGKESGYTDNYIFLPAAGYREYESIYNVGTDGYYWTSSLYSSDPVNAWQLYFFTGTKATDCYVRSCGQSVRAVCSD